MYKINIIGCDDETVIFMDMTESEYEFLSKVVAAKSKEVSTFQCMPIIEISNYSTGEK